MNSKKSRKGKYNKRLYIGISGGIVLVILIIVIILIYGKINSKQNINTSDNSADNIPETHVELETQADVPYEYWLSAAVLTGISIEYPAFEPKDFYESGETDPDDKTSSAGVYVTFTVDGQDKCIYSKPLETERTVAGTKDISSEVIGFATFDEVSPSDIPEEFSIVEIENMDELITQSTKVAVYSH